jgi:hypothetical protein
MHYTRIEIEGRPNCTATITRPGSGEFIEVALKTPSLNRTHRAMADDRDDLWSMAEAMQHALHGTAGCGGDIRECFLPLELIAGL